MIGSLFLMYIRLISTSYNILIDTSPYDLYEESKLFQSTVALGGYRLGYLVSLIYCREDLHTLGSSIVRSLVLVRPCLRLFPFMPTFLLSKFLITLLLLFLCLLLPFASPLLFTLVRYPVLDLCSCCLYYTVAID